MNATWLKENKFHPISDTTYLKSVNLSKAPTLDAHINLTFENSLYNRCDLHGTIRLVEDANRLFKSVSPEAVGRAIWVYSNKTWRSPSSLKFWLSEGGMTYAGLKSTCRELAMLLKDWEIEVDDAGSEVLQASTATSHKINLIGVSYF